jgi:hypothetical protein
MTTFDPDTLAQDANVLREIVKRFDGTLALNCDVVRGGDIHVNQDARFIPIGPAHPMTPQVPATMCGRPNEY